METIAQTLISGLRDHAQHANAEGDPTHLNLALVRAALKSENANLHNLVFQYLKEVGTEDADKLMSVLMEEAVSDPIYDYDNYDSSEVAILSSPYIHVVAALGLCASWYLVYCCQHTLGCVLYFAMVSLNNMNCH